MQIIAEMIITIDFHLFDQLNDQPKMTGMTGKTQGARTDKTPAKNEIIIIDIF
jgi:hypothetical protein